MIIKNKHKAPVVLVVSLLIIVALRLSSGTVFSTPVELVSVFTISGLLYLLLDRSKFRNTLFASFLARLFLLFWDIYARNIFILPNSGADTESFYQSGISLDFTGKSGYSLILTIIFTIIGDHRLIAQLINILLGIASLRYIEKTFDVLKIKQTVAKKCILIAAFLPNTLITTSILLRASLMIFLNSVSIYHFSRWLARPSTKDMIAATLAILGSAYFHSGMLLALIPYYLFFIFYNHESKRLKLNRRTLFYGVLAIALCIASFSSSSPFSAYLIGLDDLEKTSDRMSFYLGGGSEYLAFTASASTLPQFVLYTPLKFLYFFLSPMPWDARGAVDLLTLFFISLPVSYLTYKNLMDKNTIRNSPQSAFTLLIVILGIVYAWGSFSAGSAMRHREKIIPFIVTGYALVLSRKGEA